MKGVRFLLVENYLKQRKVRERAPLSLPIFRYFLGFFFLAIAIAPLLSSNLHFLQLSIWGGGGFNLCQSDWKYEISAAVLNIPTTFKLEFCGKANSFKRLNINVNLSHGWCIMNLIQKYFKMFSIFTLNSKQVIFETE